MTTTLAHRLENLESRFAFQEHTLETLNETLIDLRNQLDQLVLENHGLKQKLSHVLEQAGLDITEVERPPHY